MVEIKLTKLRPDARIPEYKSSDAAGADLYACMSDPISVAPYGITLVPTGLAIEIPSGYQGEVRARSGLALKEGLFVLNGPGTIDADYRGEIKIILVNLSNEPVTINTGERVAQMVFQKVEKVELEETTSLQETERGAGGFGHTGKN